MGGCHSGLGGKVSKQSELGHCGGRRKGTMWLQMRGCRGTSGVAPNRRRGLYRGLYNWRGGNEGVVVGNERAKLLGVGQKRVILRNHASSSSSKSSSSSSSPSPSSPSSSSRSSSSSPSSSSSMLPR